MKSVSKYLVKHYINSNFSCRACDSYSGKVYDLISHARHIVWLDMGFWVRVPVYEKIYETIKKNI